MIIYLDSAQNRKGAPNENFAREVMELFTLGEGQLQRAGRQGSGARVHRLEPRSRDAASSCSGRALHDDGSKTVLGRTGNFDGDDVLDILLAQPADRRVRHRASCGASSSRPIPTPPKSRASRALSRFGLRHQGRAARAADVATRSTRAKIAACWSSRRSSSSSARCASSACVRATRCRSRVAAAGMGQNLFSPPNVKGWPGGEAWINTSTLLARKQFLDRADAGRRRSRRHAAVDARRHDDGIGPYAIAGAAG